MNSNPPPDTESISVAWSPEEQAQIEVVQSTLPRDLTCPYCGGIRGPDGSRVVRFRDVPIDNVPKFTDWRRQLYRCLQCGRASKEQHPAFEQQHFITRRFADWVKAQSATNSLAQIAKQAGMNRVLLRRMFHSLVESASREKAPTLNSLAIEVVDLAGRPRPLLADIERRLVLDVLTSNAELEPFLAELAGSPAARAVTRVARDVIFDVPDFLTRDRLHEMFPMLKQTVITSRSLARQAIKMMFLMCQPLFKACAEEEKRSPKSVRNLFVRRKASLKRSASQRLADWNRRPERTSSKLLFKAHDLKERFLEIWLDVHDLVGWEGWISAVRSAPELGFKNVATFVESKRKEVDPCFGDRTLFQYEVWLDDVQKYQPEGTQSFAAARLALLTKFGAAGHD